MHSKSAIYEQLSGTLIQIERQIKVATDTANDLGISVSDLKKADGTSFLTDLLIAKAHVLHGMAVLKADKS